MRKFIMVFLVLFSSLTYSSEINLKEIVEVLKEVESLGDSQAIGDNGKAYGVLQIHKIYVEEVNMRFNTDYTHQDMFDEVCAKEVFHLYMKYATERFIKKYNKNPTEEDIVRMHNGGLYQGYKIKATNKYYKKYLKFKKIIKDSQLVQQTYQKAKALPRHLSNRLNYKPIVDQAWSLCSTKDTDI